MYCVCVSLKLVKYLLAPWVKELYKIYNLSTVVGNDKPQGSYPKNYSSLSVYRSNVLSTTLNIVNQINVYLIHLQWMVPKQ